MTEQFKWVDYYEEFASKLLEYRNKDNKIMQQALEKHGFEHCGVIYLLNGEPREAYQLVLK